MSDNKKTASAQAEGMRLDKFLKVSRIIKRRSVANDACGSEHVSVNGRPAKPGLKLKPGDVISVRYGQNTQDYEVLSLNEHVRKEDADGMYRLIK